MSVSTLTANFTRWPLGARWAVLLVLSLVFAIGLERVHLPAGPLLGAMFAAIIVSCSGGGLKLPRRAFVVAQSIVGVMIATNLPLSVFHEVAADWPIFVIGTLFTLFASSFLGWLMVRSRTFEGTTAIWGTSPGAASVMTLMSDDWGADMRLVAFMQYTRVVACAVLASGLAAWYGLGQPVSVTIEWVPPLSVWIAACPTLVMAVLASWAGLRLHLPGGALLLPMVAGMVLKLLGFALAPLPAPVLAAGFAALGLGIGLRFTPDVLRHVARSMPRVAISTVALVAVCAGFGIMLGKVAGVDPLTAVLATSPGGLDSVAIIAAMSHADVPFVMAMQTARFLCVLAFGPWIARKLSAGYRPG